MNANDYEPISLYNLQEVYNDTHDVINFKIWGFEENSIKTFLYHFVCLIFLGVPYLLFNFYPKLKSFKFKPTPLETATILLVCDSHGQAIYIKVQTDEAISNINERRYFYYQHTKYVWSSDNNEFVTLDILIPLKIVDDYLNDSNGLTNNEYTDSLHLYGSNKIEVPVKSYWVLFIEEVLNPFYIFQAFSVGLWCFDDYVSYAVCIVFLTLLSSIISLVQTRKQSEALHDLIESSKCHEVTVLRKEWETNCTRIVDPVDLVPGDLIVLPASNFIMPCDAVLITGQCTVNESVLTGESVPVTKTALHPNNELYNVETYKRHTLFSGTNVIQTRYYSNEFVLARVIRTGFDTTKGSLIKSILYPAPIGLKFYKDSFKFVFVLFIIAAIGMVYCLYLYISREAPLKDIIVRTLDIITIVVPAALPAAMAVGTAYSQSRLKKIGIYCISPPRINVCGKIKIACFDKTGTLTDDGLDMSCVIPSKNDRFCDPVTDVSQLEVDDKLVRAMATCHSLTRIDNTLNGDPLDLNMFDFTKWELEEPGSIENNRYDMLVPTIVKPLTNRTYNPIGYGSMEVPSYELGILRQFTFSSALQCMSVICRDLRQSHMVAFTKGAPEKLRNMCFPETIPNDFELRLSQYTTQGYRVIALAYKDLPECLKWKEAQKVKRDKIECDLSFLGFLIMQNPLKPETAPVIRILHSANIRTVMVTGDNMLTAISVAHDCGIVKNSDQIFIITLEDVDGEQNIIPKIQYEEVGTALISDSVTVNINNDHYHFACDGKTWNKLKLFYMDLLPHLLVRSTIFARFQPDQKTQLIMLLQKLDYIVSMVGDGANDCGALKAAHVGVSLSQAEASVAAPFTSAIPNISCIVHLMLEGRCALVTSFAIFKYMAVYSMIQFFSVLILYRFHSILGDYQFLFIDLIITTSLAVTIGRQGPSNVLCPKRPMTSLVSAKNVFPLLLQIFMCAVFQIVAMYYLYQQSWFHPIPSDTVEAVEVSWENTTIFTVSCYQYIILATVYSKGRPYRQKLITNFWFLVSAIGLVVTISWLIVYPCSYITALMELVEIPYGNTNAMNFRYSLLVFPIGQFFIAVLIEVGMSDRQWLKKFIQFLTCKSVPKNRYKLLLQDDSLHPSINM